MKRRINVSKEIGSPSALTGEKGKIIYDIIVEAINNDDCVILDFSDIESSITPFYNAAIGKLYEHYTSNEIEKHLEFANFPQSKIQSLNLVIKNAKRYYKDKEKYDATISEVIEE